MRIFLICLGLLLPALAYPGAAQIERAQKYFGDPILLDQDGNPQRFFSDLLRDKVVLINVVFTRCEDACPMQTHKLRQVQQQLGDRFGKDIEFISLSVDPERDTPASLKAFAIEQKAYGPGWHFLVAEADTMRSLLGRLGTWVDEPLEHSTLLIAGNVRTAHWVKIRPSSQTERVVYDLLRLANEQQ